MMDEYAELMMLGVRVRAVHDLKEGSIYHPGRRLLLVDSSLSQSDREHVCRRFLPEALGMTDSTGPIRPGEKVSS